MDVAELIKVLSSMPQDAKVFGVYDGAARLPIEVVWVSKAGDICFSDADAVVYSDEDRPVSAPPEKDDPYWRAPSSSVQSGIKST